MSEKRIYNTKQRDTILRCIESFGDAHFTAADVVERLSGKIGQATVYRMIDRLADEGRLRKYVVDGTTAACYQSVPDNDAADCRDHFHLKCEVCGRLIHVECGELTRIADHVKSGHGFEIDKSRTVFYGICRECAK